MTLLEARRAANAAVSGQVGLAQPMRPITAEERQAFHRDGAVVLRGVLQPEWLRQIASIIDDFYKVEQRPFETGWLDPGRAPMHGGGFLYGFVDSARDFVHHSPAAAIAGALLGSKRLYYFEDQVLCRKAGPVSTTAWHQDIPYWKTEGEQLVRLWIPIDPVPAEVALQTIRGSHRWGVTYRPHNVKHSPDGTNISLACERDSSQPLAPNFWEMADSFDIQRHAAEPGDVVALHAARIVHGVPPSDIPYGQRRVYCTVFAGEDMVFHDRPTTNLVPHEFLKEPLQEGEPLSHATGAYPLVWERTTAARG
jgi:ectoine hydroxylase-related dioxygenase (phytanoyl-CoA dioxygenase family)